MKDSINANSIENLALIRLDFRMNIESKSSHLIFISVILTLCALK